MRCQCLLDQAALKLVCCVKSQSHSQSSPIGGLGRPLNTTTRLEGDLHVFRDESSKDHVSL